MQPDGHNASSDDRVRIVGSLNLPEMQYREVGIDAPAPLVEVSRCPLEGRDGPCRGCREDEIADLVADNGGRL